MITLRSCIPAVADSVTLLKQLKSMLVKAQAPSSVTAPPSALAVVSTSLHLIYLAELSHKYRFGSLETIVLLKRPTDKAQIERVLPELCCDAIHWVERTGTLQNRYISLAELSGLRELKLTRNVYDYGVFADYGRSILANIDCKQLYWIGDGTKIIYETSKCARRGVSRYTLHRLADPVTRLLLGKRLVLPRDPVIFTPFQLETGTWDVNDFDWLRSRYAFEPDANDLSTVYFFGSYFSERNGKPLLADSDYLRYMHKVVCYFRDRGLKVVYVPHRHESDAKLAKLDRIPGCRVEAFTYPAEMEFYLRRQYPAHVASFFSTCLFHFELMGICRTVTSFYIDFGRHNSFYEPVAREIYKALGRALGEHAIIPLDITQEQAA